MKKKFCFAAVCGILFLVLIVLLRTVDVAPIGPEGTNIGLSHFNQAVWDHFGVNMTWYDITDWLGIAAILTAAAFGVVGLIELIRRKDLLKVDPEILMLGGLYIIVIGLYVLFEIVVINHRPIIMPGDEHVEASFPSSHTMLICTVMGSAIMVMKKFVKNAGACRVLQVLCGLIIAVTIVGRLVSGVHWAADIIGGILISTALLALFAGVRDAVGQKAAD